jgi:hypothetical protein
LEANDAGRRHKIQFKAAEAVLINPPGQPGKKTGLMFHFAKARHSYTEIIGLPANIALDGRLL